MTHLITYYSICAVMPYIFLLFFRAERRVPPKFSQQTKASSGDKSPIYLARHLRKRGGYQGSHSLYS